MFLRLRLGFLTYAFQLFLVLCLLHETWGFAVVPHPPAAKTQLSKVHNNHGQSIRVGESRFHASRKAAFQSVKLDLRIPKAQSPDKVISVPMTDRNGRAVLNEGGRPVTTREYHFTRADRSVIVIQDHGFGHDFGHPDGIGNQGPHFNVRPVDPLTKNAARNGVVPGALEHYSW